MNEVSMILEIPIETLHTTFKVEKDDPLRPIMNHLKSFEEIDSTSQSVHRLDALSRFLPSNSKISEHHRTVVRDLWKGKFWKMGEKGLSLAEDITGSIHRLAPIQRLDVSESEGKVKDLAKLFLGGLSTQSQIPRNEIMAHVRLESLDSVGEVEFLRTRISQKVDRTGRRFWVHQDGPFEQLISEHIDVEPGFEITKPEITDNEFEWPYSPEVEALMEFKRAASKFNQDPQNVQKTALKILDTITERITQDDRPRLDEVKQVVGFRQDMWDVAQEVIRSARERVFILTSFSNPKFLDDMAELLAEATEGGQTRIILSFGEPDRSRSPTDIQETEQYLATLAEDKRFSLEGGVSPKSSHAKLVVSDAGYAFISSCNLFSGSLESGVLESGLLIKDGQCAKSMLEVSKGEEWVPTHLVNDTAKMCADLGKIKPFKFELSEYFEQQIESIKDDIHSGEDWYAYTKLERMLRDLAERPTWALIRTLEHRPFMADCIERFQKRIVMASDGLRSNGLDQASIRRIGERASESRSSVHIWWGRHPPGSRHLDEIDARGRNEAKNQLAKLRGSGRDARNNRKKGRIMNIHMNGYGFIRAKPKNVHVSKSMIEKFQLKVDDQVEYTATTKPGQKNPTVLEFTKIRGESKNSSNLSFELYPAKSDEPMETHAKMFIVDDTRLMITSDNSLSFGDTEAERGNAGELGIVIDHPRLALQTRGSMELWIPNEAKEGGDLARWWALLGEEVSLHTTKPFEQMSLIRALDSMIERIESNENLSAAWEQEVEEKSDNDELTIINKLVLGGRHGMYCVAKSTEASGIKSKLKTRASQ